MDKMLWTELRDKAIEINGMKLKHWQTQPEIQYKGCVICWLHEDGTVESVGTRLTDLTAKEFTTLKKILGCIDFSVNEISVDEQREKYIEHAHKILDEMTVCISEIKEDVMHILDGYGWRDFKNIRDRLYSLETIAEKYKSLCLY